MERTKIVTIKWINDKGSCKVAFMVGEEVYLLIRNLPFDIDKTIWGLECNKEHEVSSEEGAVIWKELKKEHGFEEVKI